MFDIKGITLHETNNSLNARQNIQLMKRSGMVSVHFFVDGAGAFTATDLNQNTWHTGKAYDFGNMHTISIEICKNGHEKAYELVKKLLKEYNLTKENIYFHKDFNPKSYCPNLILRKYKTKENFLKGVFNGY